MPVTNRVYSSVISIQDTVIHLPYMSPKQAFRLLVLLTIYYFYLRKV